MLHRTMRWSMRMKRRQNNVAPEEEEEAIEASMMTPHCFAPTFFSNDTMVDESKDEAKQCGVDTKEAVQRCT